MFLISIDGKPWFVGFTSATVLIVNKLGLIIFLFVRKVNVNSELSNVFS